MQRKKSTGTESIKLNNAIKYSEESRDSNTGYQEKGNDATIHARARALRNKDDRTDL
jgi:DNA polymerase sigma